MHLIVPAHRAVNAIARNARLVADDRFSSTAQPVEKRGFADIRSADNRNLEHTNFEILDSRFELNPGFRISNLESSNNSRRNQYSRNRRYAATRLGAPFLYLPDPCSIPS